ncbi:ferritin-like domain-containing protein [Limibacillus halophilus]|jgi:rubrerythrin
MSKWTLDDIPWERFDPKRVDPELLKIAKAAAMVEYNGGDYAHYLCNVFADDEEFKAAARDWAVEEVQHGQALGRWAEMADPSFDFEASFERFVEGYRIPLEAQESVRGSRSGELVARCIVEVGTSSYYSALGSACEEPVLREICKKIAADELRHYKLFYTHLKRYLAHEEIGKARRLMIALKRMGESEDDELAYAYYAANSDGEPYDRRAANREYMRRAYSYYRPQHVERAAAMTFKAAGLNPQSRMVQYFSKAAYGFIQFRSKRLAQQAAAAA